MLKTRIIEALDDLEEKEIESVILIAKDNENTVFFVDGTILTLSRMLAGAAEHSQGLRYALMAANIALNFDPNEAKTENPETSNSDTSVSEKA